MYGLRFFILRKRVICVNKKKRISAALFVLVLAILIFGVKFYGYSKQTEPVEMITVNNEDLEWNLILVNNANHIPKDYEVSLITLSNGEQVDERIYPELQAMFDDARASGLGLFVAAGYRTQETQQKLLDEKIKEYIREGYSLSRAEALAAQWVAVPGTSEHQLGIAVDINADTDISSREEVYEWLAENSYKYGFINRYPKDKTRITGIANEPWHYRYVGREAAEEIYEKGLCLEEYIEQLQ